MRSRTRKQKLELVAYSLKEGVATLANSDGAELSVPIGWFANQDDLIALLSPEDAFRLGSFHESSRRRRMAQAEQEAANG